jgi:hypothetical protein
MAMATHFKARASPCGRSFLELHRMIGQSEDRGICIIQFKIRRYSDIDFAALLTGRKRYCIVRKDR